jgi:hypothetical protein
MDPIIFPEDEPGTVLECLLNALMSLRWMLFR